MKTSKRFTFGILTCGVGLVALYFFSNAPTSVSESGSVSQPPVQIHLPPMRKPSSANPSFESPPTQRSRKQSENPKVVRSGKLDTFEESEFRKTSGQIGLNDFPRSSLGKSNYSVVVNLHASLSRIEHLTEVAHSNGIYYYDNRSKPLPENTVFDLTVDKVGLWSGEISVDGTPEIFDEIKKTFDMEAINEQHGRAIFKAGPNFSLKEDYPALAALVVPGQIQLDLKFSKMQRQ